MTSTILPSTYRLASKSTAKAMKSMQDDADQILADKDKIILELNQRIDELEEILNSKTFENKKSKYNTESQIKELEISLQQTKEKAKMDMKNLTLRQQRELEETKQEQEEEISSLEKELESTIQNQRDFAKKRAKTVNQENINYEFQEQHKGEETFIEQKIKETKSKSQQLDLKVQRLESELQKLTHHQNDLLTLQRGSKKMDSSLYTNGNKNKNQEKRKNRVAFASPEESSDDIQQFESRKNKQMIQRNGKEDDSNNFKTSYKSMKTSKINQNKQNRNNSDTSDDEDAYTIDDGEQFQYEKIKNKGKIYDANKPKEMKKEIKQIETSDNSDDIDEPKDTSKKITIPSSQRKIRKDSKINSGVNNNDRQQVNKEDLPVKLTKENKDQYNIQNIEDSNEEKVLPHSKSRKSSHTEKKQKKKEEKRQEKENQYKSKIEDAQQKYQAKISELEDQHNRELNALESKLQSLKEDVEIVKKSQKNNKQNKFNPTLNSSQSPDTQTTPTKSTKSTFGISSDTTFVEAEIVRLVDENEELRDLLAKYDKLAYGEKLY